MTYTQALETLRDLKSTYDKLHNRENRPENSRQLSERAMQLYGRIEPIALQLLGDKQVEVDQGGGHKAKYKNYIETILYSGRTFYDSDGYGELVRLIGRVEQLSEDPSLPALPQSATSLLQVLGRFRACCQYLEEAPRNERAVQDILWIMLRGIYDRLERESTLPKFGVKSYRPDFGIPDLAVLIEAKYIGETTDPKAVQEEILADLVPYIAGSDRYSQIVVIVYDAAHKLRDARPFIDDLRTAVGVLDVIVVPGV